jgi:hypothetical protein
MPELVAGRRAGVNPHESNEVFKVERGELTLALRRPPRVG